MNADKPTRENPAEANLKPDERTSEGRANPVGTAAGAAGGAAAGAAVGIMGGPVGLAAGAVAGALAGGALGKDQFQPVDKEDEYWRQNFASRPYVREGARYEDYAQAYRYGYQVFDEYPGRSWHDARADIGAGWQVDRGNSRLEWEEAEPAIREAWERRALRGS
jgi:hypothetical protein